MTSTGRKPTWKAAVAAVLALAALLAMPAGASAAGSLEAHGSVNQVYVTGAQPGTQLTLLEHQGKAVGIEAVGSLGGALFRDVAAGKDYRVRAADGALSAPVGVLK